MLEGRRAKARRGDLAKPLPMGYVRRPSGEVILDPDEQVQSVIRLVFELFERTRTVGGVLNYLTEHDIKMPVRRQDGPTRGDLNGTGPTGPRCIICLPTRPMPASILGACARPIGGARSRGALAPGDARRAPRTPKYSCPTDCPPISAGSSSSAFRRDPVEPA